MIDKVVIVPRDEREAREVKRVLNLGGCCRGSTLHARPCEQAVK